MTLPASVAGPVVRGQQLGTVTVSRDGVQLATVPLLADADLVWQTVSQRIAWVPPSLRD